MRHAKALNIKTRGKIMKTFWQLLRVHHWIKNGLIFLPLFFSGQFLQPFLLVKNILGFLAFSLTTSVIYIINDSFDIENDRKHPIKCKRPLASGAISVSQAYTIAGALLAFALFLNFLTVNLEDLILLLKNSDFAAGFFADGFAARLTASIQPTPLLNNIITWLIIAAYIILNYGYSRGLKNVPLVDIAILVSGFILRVFYGSTISNIQASHWLYLTVFALSFYMGFGKRRNEIIKQGNESRGVLKHYSYNFLDKNMYLCLALTIVFYALWTVDPATYARYGSYKLIWTVPLVMLICMKYSLNIEQRSHGDPVDVVLSDKVLLTLIILFLLIMLLLIYLVS